MRSILKRPFVNRIFIVLIMSFLTISCLLVFSAKFANASTLYFTPSISERSVGDILSVDIRVNTQNKYINSVGGEIIFPKDLLDVVSISKSGSIFSLWVENPSFNNSIGIISFNGGLPTPGFLGASGKIISVVFRIKNSGTASLLFSSASVLANDGLGTDTLQNKGIAQFTLISQTKNQQSVPNVSGAPSAPNITSPTHPNSDKWYDKNSAIFKWDISRSITALRLLYGENPYSSPSVFYGTPISEKEIPDLKDGVYYFHSQLKNKNGWGGISHFKFKVDTIAPKQFDVAIDNGGDTTNPTPILNFKTSDETSGIDHYEIKIGDGDIILVDDGDIVNGFRTPVQAFGEHSLVIKAVDKAGNYTTASGEILVNPINPPAIEYYPKELNVDDVFAIRGSSEYPGSMIRLFIEHDGGDMTIKDVKSDKDGKWIYAFDDKIESGIYKFYVQNIDTRGAISEIVGGFITIVKTPKWIKAGGVAINYLSIIIPLLVLVFALILIVLYGWRKIIIEKKKIFSEAKLAEKYSKKAFGILKGEINIQINRIRKKQIVSKEDGEVANNLEKALKESERLVEKSEKELRKIEKEGKG